MRLILFILLLLPTFCLAQSETALLTLAGKQEHELNDAAAFETYKRTIRLYPKNYTALWKASELGSKIGSRQPTPKEKQEFFNNARIYAQAAIKVNPAGADGYYTLAVAMGRMALTQSGREKVNSVKEIRSNAEHAIRLNPNHAKAWHVLGKWHYEVANLGMFEKAALRVVYGGLPAASFSESIKAYERARQLEPWFLLNYLELAKALDGADQRPKAIEYLKKLSALPNKTADDPRIKESAARLMKEWQND